jgi:hypothetical protein
MAANKKAFFCNVEQTSREAATARDVENSRRLGLIATTLGANALIEPQRSIRLAFR